jgi:hypothetical protein
MRCRQMPEHVDLISYILENTHMAQLIPASTIISAEEALRTEILLNQALIDILITKKIISEDELIRNIRKIKREQEILAENLDCLG